MLAVSERLYIGQVLRAGTGCGSSNRSATQIISTHACQKGWVKGRTAIRLGLIAQRSSELDNS